MEFVLFREEHKFSLRRSNRKTVFLTPLAYNRAEFITEYTVLLNLPIKRITRSSAKPASLSFLIKLPITSSLSSVLALVQLEKISMDLIENKLNDVF